MTDNVVSLKEYKEKKKKTDMRVYRDSLDNDKVMERYKINQPTIEERRQRITESIKRINSLLTDLETKK